MRRLLFPVMFLLFLAVSSPQGLFAATVAGSGQRGTPVLIGLDAEIGHKTSTSDDAIRMGIEVALAEINAAGGVLGGRPLQLVVRDNRSVPARGVANVEEFATMSDLVAIFCGKFSPVIVEELPALHRHQLILLDPWAAADAVVDNGYQPNYVYRLSLRDSWAQPALLRQALARGAQRVALLLPNTGWGRGNLAAAELFVKEHGRPHLASVQWYNWGDTTLREQYQRILQSGAEALILVANEPEGSLLVRELAALPKSSRLPLISHWGISGGDFARLAGPALREVDLVVVQTYSFSGAATSPIGRRVLQTLRTAYGIEHWQELLSPVGVAHAYDLTHLLAQAIERAGTTARPAVREALEHLPPWQGLVRHYASPFTAERHEALDAKGLFFCRYAVDGTLQPLTAAP